MATCLIAGACGASKIVYARANILRSAHAAARKRMAPSRECRNGDRWSAEASGYVPHNTTYRKALSFALLMAWSEAKVIAEEAAWAASQPKLPDDVASLAASLRLAASYEPHTLAGHDRYDALHREATQIEEAARETITPPSMATAKVIDIRDWVSRQPVLTNEDFLPPSTANWSTLWLPGMLDLEEFNRLAILGQTDTVPQPGRNEAPTWREVWTFLFNRVVRAQHALPNLLEESPVAKELWDILTFLEEHAPDDLIEDGDGSEDDDDPIDPDPGEPLPKPPHEQAA